MKLSGSDVANLRLGGEQVIAAYLGSSLVWSAGVRLKGALLATTALAGGLDVGRSLEGALAAAASLSGATGVERGLSGTASATSELDGDLGVFDEVLLAGDLASAASLGGDVSVARALAGSVAALSDASGSAATTERVLAGVAAAVSQLAASAKVARALSGAMGAVSSNVGALTVTPAPLAGLSVVATNSNGDASTSSLSIPAHNAGDLILVYVRTGGGGDIAAAPGYTRLAISNTGTTHALVAKIADGTETEYPHVSGASSRRALWILRGTNKTISSFSVASLGTWDNIEITDGNPAAQTIQTSVGPFPVIGFAAMANDNGTSLTRSWSPAATSELTVAASFLYAGIRIINVGDTATDTVVDMNDPGSANKLMSMKITVA